MAVKKLNGQKNELKLKKSKDSELNQSQIVFLPSISVCSKCCVCEESIEEDSQPLRCDNCGKVMHADCWDSDISNKVCTYIHEAQSNGLCGFRMYCTVCINFVD